jgi:hypothetical protein
MFQTETEDDDNDSAAFFTQALPVPDMINVDLSSPPNTGLNCFLSFFPFKTHQN